MAVNKNFVVKNGLEVSTDLILADAARNKVGIGSTTPRTELDVRGGIAATDINISGVGTIVTLQSTTGTITNLTSSNLTAGAVQATHITASGVTTAATLNVTGTGTIAVGVITNLSGTNLKYTGISTLGVTTVTQLNSAGIVTASSFVPTSGYIKAPDGTNSFYIYSTTGNVAFQGTIGASQLNSGTGHKVIGLAGSDAVFTRNVSIPGITTLGSVVFNSGIVTATSGIITYYGDGRYLQNVISGVGLGSTGGVIGYGVTFINFFGAGVSTAYYSSTTGIATIYITGGGGGGSASIGIGSTPGEAFTGIITAGNLWYNSDLGRLFIYYQDADSAQWVDAAPFNIGSLNPVSIALSTGTVSSPSLYFSSDTDTGLFQPTPNQQTFVAAGASVLNVNPGGINVTGVVTASSFRGDGSNLTNLPAGLGTALSSDQTSPLNKIYYTDQVLSIGSTVTVDPPSTAKVAYTQYAEIQVESGADLIIADGDDFIPNILGIGTTGTVGTIGGGGRVRADNFSNRSGSGAPTFNAGLNVTGVLTATSFIGDGSGLTGAGATLNDDTTTSATYYPVFSTATTGSLTTAKVSSTKLTYDPSLGKLTATIVNSSSDENLKKDISTVENALDKVNQLRGVNFTWKDNNEKSVGMIAQELQEVFPELVYEDENGLSINYNGLIGVLIEAIKELSNK